MIYTHAGMKNLRVGIALAESRLHCSLVCKDKNRWRRLASHHYTFSAGNLCQTLLQIRAQIPRTARCTILGLPYHRVLMKEIKIDAQLNDEEIYRYLQNQAIALYAKPAQYWFMDYEVCDLQQQQSLLMKIRSISASREELFRLQKDFRTSRLTLSRVDVDVLALSRLTPTLEFYNPDQAQALIWIKQNEVLFLAVKTGKLIYVKRAPLSPEQNLNEILPGLIHFYHRLYPQHPLEDIFLIDENPTSRSDSFAHPLLKTILLNPMIWHTDQEVDPGDFCSLGLAIYEH